MAPRADTMFAGLRSPEADSGDGRWPDPEGFRGQASEDGSYVRGALDVPAQVALMQGYAATGNSTAAMTVFNGMKKFAADHPEDIVRGATMDPGRDPYLRSVQAASHALLTNAYDEALVYTPDGNIPARAAFGPGGYYEQQKGAEARVKAGFSDPELTAAMDAGDDRSRLLGKVVAPVMRASWRTGERVGNLSQYKALARLLTKRSDLEDLGFAAMDAVVDNLLDYHMKDGSVQVQYDNLVRGLRARKTSLGDDFDGALEAHRLATSLDAVNREVAGGPRGELSGSAGRGMGLVWNSLLSSAPDVDPGSAPVRAAVAQTAGLLARFDRAGIPLVTVMANAGYDVSQTLGSYTASLASAGRASDVNKMTKLASALDLVTQSLTDGWEPVRVQSRGNPDELAGSAAGVFGASSGFSGVDSASFALVRPLLTAVARRLKEDNLTPVDALRAALDDDAVTSEAVASVSGFMGVPMDVASAVYRRYVETAFSEQGVLRPGSLDKVVADLAFTFTTDPARIAMQPALTSWYARNVGETGAYYDSLLGAEWDRLLFDDTVGVLAGYTNRTAASAAREVLRQQAKREMNAAVANGLSAELVARKYRSRGRHYAITGYVDLNGRSHDLNELDAAIRKASDRARFTVRGLPIISEVADGSLDDAVQPYSNWILPNGMRLPELRPGSWSASRESQDRLLSVQRLLRGLYLSQQKAAEKAYQQVEGPDGIHVPSN